LVILHFGATNVINATIRLCDGEKHSSYFGCKNNFFTNKTKIEKYYINEKHLNFILYYKLYD
jgi:hypothetical protein